MIRISGARQNVTTDDSKTAKRQNGSRICRDDITPEKIIAYIAKRGGQNRDKVGKHMGVSGRTVDNWAGDVLDFIKSSPLYQLIPEIGDPSRLSHGGTLGPASEASILARLFQAQFLDPRLDG